MFVRPYGSVYRRPGMRFMAQCKYPDKKAILVEFNFSTSISYLLEFGHKYIRVFKDNVYLGVEVASPFEEKELRKLRFTQSGDTLFIASGVRNVQLLQRFNEMDWRMKEMDLTNPYFDILATSSGTAAQNAGRNEACPCGYDIYDSRELHLHASPLAVNTPSPCRWRWGWSVVLLEERQFL